MWKLWEAEILKMLWLLFQKIRQLKACMNGRHCTQQRTTACFLLSIIAESGKGAGVFTVPIMSKNYRETIGNVKADYIIFKPLPDYSCDMKSSFSKYWKLRIPLDDGWILRNAASHGAAFVEFNVHLSKDFVLVVYHDLTCCLTMKNKSSADPVELFEIPMILESLTKDVAFSIEINFICQQRDGMCDGSLPTYFDMNLFLDTIF
ncbi:hypothetical protein MC885_009712 [Smutsia gigantea]|nr:hypothetical protein MC885_009712 [Smutsia gigantea]